MASPSNIMEDDTLLSRLDRLLFRLETKLALLGGIAVFSLMVLAVISVSGRNFANAPLPGYVDWIEQTMPLIAFVAVSYTQRLGGHIRMDIVIGRLRGRPLWLVELLSTLVMLSLMLLLVWGTFSHFLRAFDMSAPLWSRDSSMDIGIPLWPSKLIVPVGFSVLSLRLLLQAWGFGRAFATGATRPVAVPLYEDAATAAANEAATVSGFNDKEDFLMEPIDIGLVVTGIMLVFVIIGVRVAFAAALAGMIGLIWIFWAKKGYDPAQFQWALTVAVKTAGQVPHSKVSSQALSLIPTFILIGFLAYYAASPRRCYRRQTLDRLAAGRPCGLDRVCHGGLCCGLGRERCDLGCVCPYRHSRNAGRGL